MVKCQLIGDLGDNGDATLLSEGYPIRLTGQDVRRGTFSTGFCDI
ncbi:MAG: hypothetical protein CM15mP127_09790 [Gammaproteobacteria bacterium]|nr:MAG: hypothetical protein CM15mP127_09790 [Gammaproteobacteria bacterium]